MTIGIKKIHVGILLVMVGVFFCGCGHKIAKTYLHNVWLNEDALTVYDNLPDNFWRDCFESENQFNDMRKDFEKFHKECVLEELSSLPTFMTSAEVKAASESIVFCHRLKMWKKYKDDFTLDKVLGNKKKLSFCKKMWDFCKKYK